MVLLINVLQATIPRFDSIYNISGRVDVGYFSNTNPPLLVNRSFAEEKLDSEGLHSVQHIPMKQITKDKLVPSFSNGAPFPYLSLMVDYNSHLVPLNPTYKVSCSTYIVRQLLLYMISASFARAYHCDLNQPSSSLGMLTGFLWY